MGNTVHDAMDIISMLPYESSNTGIFRNSFRDAIFIFVASGRSLDRKIVNKNVRNMRNFFLQNKNHAILEFSWGVGESHRH